jgi:hypothetical protein
MTTVYTKAQMAALNTFLSYWPDGLTYAQVIERLNADDTQADDSDDSIDACGVFEYLWGEDLAQLITSLHDQLISVYGD